MTAGIDYIAMMKPTITTHMIAEKAMKNRNCLSSFMTCLFKFMHARYINYYIKNKKVDIKI